MKKSAVTLIIFFFGFLPLHTNALTSVQVSTANSGGIQSTTQSTAGGSDASATVYTQNVTGSEAGNVQVRIDTVTNGVAQTEIVTNTTQGSGSGKVDVFIATTSKSVVLVASSVEGSTLLATSSAFFRLPSWFGRVFGSYIDTEVIDEVPGNSDTQLTEESTPANSKTFWSKFLEKAFFFWY